MTITKEEVQKLLDRMTFECVNCEMDHALAEDIGKTLIAESARADQAEAAMAAMVERCAEAVTPQDVYGDGRYFRVPGFHQAGCAYKDNDLVAAANIAVERIRALASPSGLALVRELRADADRLNRWRAEEGEKIKRQAKALTDLTKHCQRIEAENAGLARKIGKVQRGDGDHSQIADLEAKVINQRNELANLRARDGRLAELAVERDTLAAANSMLEAKVAGLVEALEPSAETKAAYMGEFYMGVTMSHPRLGEETRKVQIPWTTIKEVMAAIRARAALASGKPGEAVE